MSMASTQKPANFYPVRQASPPVRYQSQPAFQSNQKHMRMSIIDQLSPIKDLPVMHMQQRSSFYQVKGKAQNNPLLVTTRTQPTRLSESSFNTTLNYTQESQQLKSSTMPKVQKLNTYEVLRDQLRFSICQLDDLKKQCEISVQQQIEQVISIIRSSYGISGQMIDQIQKLNVNQEYEKLKGIMEQMQNKITLLVNDNNKLNSQLVKCLDENKQLLLLQQESQRQIKQYQSQTSTLQSSQIKENTCPNQSQNSIINQKFSFSHRELAYKLEQAEIRLLTLQISNDNLRQQIQHNQVDQQGLEAMRNTIQILESKSSELINQKDGLSQENELLHRKVQSIEVQLSDYRQRAESSNNYLEYIQSVENQCKQLTLDNSHIQNTNLALNNTINQMKEQIQIVSKQKQDVEQSNINIIQQLQNELKQASSKYGLLWSEITEMRERLEQRKIQEDSGKMISIAEKGLFETQISNLNDKVKEYEGMLLHFENKSRNVENHLFQVQRENDSLKQELLAKTQSPQQKFQMELDETRWRAENLQQQLSKRDKEFKDKVDELQQIRQLYDQQLNKNQNLEMRILYFMEQEVKQAKIY
ncbi:hypothetical protein pb186bvf_016874 [Paramecium bursaria]